MSHNKRAGFTLIELMIVTAIIACLSMIAVPSFTRFLAKAKRAEAYIHLAALAKAQKAYWAENGTYTTNMFDSDGLAWKPEGNLRYSYGFGGSENKNHYIGQLKTPASELAVSKISPDGFIIAAAGDIDGDGEADVITIDHNNKIEILKDDLK